MNSSSWMNALERFDRNVDINSITKKEVSLKYHNISLIINSRGFFKIVDSLNVLFDNQE